MERIKSQDSLLRRSGLNIRMGDAAGWTEARYSSALMITTADLATLMEGQWISSIVSTSVRTIDYRSEDRSLFLYVRELHEKFKSWPMICSFPAMKRGLFLE